MAIRTIVTRGYGNGTFNGTIGLVVRRGYSPAAAAVIFEVDFEIDEDDISDTAATGTAGIATAQDLTVVCNGSASWRFAGTGDVATGAIVYQTNDIYGLGGATDEFIIEGQVNFHDLATASLQIMMSYYHSTLNNRSWVFYRTGADIGFFASTDGGTVNAVTATRTVNWVEDVWYHVAISRDSSGDMRLFFNGAQQGASFSLGTSFFTSAAASLDLRLGTFSVGPSPLYGYLDNWKITTGDSYTIDFTPPACDFGVARVNSNPMLVHAGRMMTRG